MIDYKLAKELKDAGFPQRQCIFDRYLWSLGNEPTPDNHFRIGMSTFPSGGELAYAPTFSELVEACGPAFNSLYQRVKSGWVAKAQKKLVAGGSTPEEAVARLWLALQTENKQ